MGIKVTLHRASDPGFFGPVMRTFKDATTWAFSDVDGHKSLLVIKGDIYNGEVVAEFMSDDIESVEDV